MTDGPAADAAEPLRRVGIDVAQATVETVPHNRWLTPGIWVVHTGGRRFVVKHLRLYQGAAGTTPFESHWTIRAEEPQHWNYWAREGLAYPHGLPAALGVDAPALEAVAEGDDDIVLLLEFVEGVPAEQWAVPDYADAALALGRAQGRLLAGRAETPRHAWLSRRFLREYSTEKEVEWSLLDDDAAWEHPLVRRTFPPELREAAVWLHEHRTTLYDLAESLPRTLCHLDFWTKNLIRRPDGRVAVLDWSFTGDGAVGEDVGNLVPDAVFDHFVPAEEQPALEAVVFEAYARGLREAGWDGDERVARLGMLASAVKYDWLTPAMLRYASADAHRRYGGGDIDPDYLFRERGLALLHNARAAQRAMALAAVMGRRG